MENRLIDYYNDELQHLRREAAEFAAEFQEAAPMLTLDQGRVQDPYVERLLEGVAYLAARVRLKLDAQYPVFTQQLLEVLFPGWLAPAPPACVLRLNPSLADDKLTAGPFVKPRTVVRGSIRGASAVRCEFETTRPLQLLPLVIDDVRYVAASPAALAGVPEGVEAESSLQLALSTTGSARLAQLQSLDALPIFVSLPEPHGSHLLELVAGRCVGVALSQDPNFRSGVHWLPGSSVRHLGFDADDVMVPRARRAHVGFRLLREYAALPEKFRFFEVSGLRSVLQAFQGDRCWLRFYLGRAQRNLESVVRKDSLALFCVPAVNLRERLLDRIDIQPGQAEYQLVGDRTSVRRYEVVSVEEVRGGGAGFESVFQPVFEVANRRQLNSSSFYTLRRERRRFTEAERKDRLARLRSTAGVGRSIDLDSLPDPSRGTEVFLSLGEAGAGPHGRDLQYISVRALCMEREVPTLLREQNSLARYECVDTLPVQAVDCMAGPSDPLDYAVDGFDPWLVLSHLQVNYLSLQEQTGSRAAEALRSMLRLFAPHEAHRLVRQADALTEVGTSPVTRRLSQRGVLAFARGLHVRLTMSDRGFDGGSPFVLGALLDHYLAGHVNVNSFVETSLAMKEWSKEVRWQRSLGTRPTH